MKVSISNEEFAKALKARLRALGWQQIELHRKVYPLSPTNQSTTNQIMNGKYDLSALMVQRYSEAALIPDAVIKGWISRGPKVDYDPETNRISDESIFGASLQESLAIRGAEDRSDTEAQPNRLSDLSVIEYFTPSQRYLYGEKIDEPGDLWRTVKHTSVPRHQTDAIIDDLVSHGLCLTTAAGGEGLSTIAKQVALGLTDRGYPAYFFDSPLDLIPNYSSAPSEPARSFVIVDNAHEIGHLPALLDFSRKHPKVKVAIFAREYPWLTKQLFPKFRPSNASRLIEHHLARLTKEEIEGLIQTMKTEGILATGMNEQDARELMTSTMGSQGIHMFVAVLSLSQGRSYRSILDSIISDFIENEEEGIIKQVALRDFLITRSFLRLPELSFHEFRGIILEHLDNSSPLLPLDNSYSRVKKSEKIMRRISSEVVSRRASRKSTVTYGFRHPDIATRIFERFYFQESDVEQQDTNFLIEDVIGHFYAIQAGLQTGRGRKPNHSGIYLVSGIFKSPLLRDVFGNGRIDLLKAYPSEAGSSTC